MAIMLKRVYEESDPSDGTRILVDRLWPRGLTKERAQVDHWIRDVAPSESLRKWFGHRPERWPEFKIRYRKELESAARVEAIAELRRLCGKGKVTILFGARDEKRNQAVALVEILSLRQLGAGARRRSSASMLSRGTRPGGSNKPSKKSRAGKLRR